LGRFEWDIHRRSPISWSTNPCRRRATGSAWPWWRPSWSVSSEPSSWLDI